MYRTADQVMECPLYRAMTAGPGQTIFLLILTYFTSDQPIVYSSARCNISGRKSFRKVTTVL